MYRKLPNIFLVLILALYPGFFAAAIDDPPGWESSGIADIDATRLEVKESPTTTENAIPRRATLYRWWRFLMHQGYDMSPFDETADILLKESHDLWLDQEFSTPRARQAISEGFAVLEEIYAGGMYVEEVKGSDPARGADPVAGSSPDGKGTTTDWPFYHGVSGAQTGHSPDPGPSLGKVAWRYPKGFNWIAKPVLENGKVYISSPGVDVIAYCLDENSGDIYWKGRQFRTHYYFYRGSRVDPVLSEAGMLVRAGREKFLFDKQDGKMLMRENNREQSGETSYVEVFTYSSGGKTVYLADAGTGNISWKKEMEDWLAGEPMLAGQKVYAATINGQVLCLDAEDGSLNWSSETGLSLDGPVSAGANRLHAGSSEAKLVCIDPADGADTLLLLCSGNHVPHLLV